MQIKIGHKDFLIYSSIYMLLLLQKLIYKDDYWIMSKRTKNFSMDTRNTEKKCEPCTYFEKNVVATCICCQCKEYMCSDCRSHHLSQKQSKTHQIKSFEEKLMCGPCHTNGKKVVASSFCQDCADPEALCTLCTDHHKASNTTKEHRISSDMDIYLIR